MLRDYEQELARDFRRWAREQGIPSRVADQAVGFYETMAGRDRRRVAESFGKEPFSEDLGPAFRAFARRCGFEAHAEAIVGWYEAEAEWLAEQAELARDAEHDVLEVRWGHESEANYAQARRAAQALGLDEAALERFVAAAGFDGAMERLRAHGEKLSWISPAVAGLDAGQARARIEQIRRDPSFAKRLEANDRAAKLEFEQLHDLAYGTAPVGSGHEVRPGGAPQAPGNVARPGTPMLPGGSSDSPDQARARIAALIRDPAFVERYTRGDAGAKAEMKALHDVAYSAPAVSTGPGGGPASPPAAAP
jgi:hypothetical protein